MKKCKLKANCKITCETILNSVDISSEFFEGEMDSYIYSFDTAGHKITIYIKEKYFYRIKSTITVTLIIDQTEEDTTVEIVSAEFNTPYACPTLRQNNATFCPTNTI